MANTDWLDEIDFFGEWSDDGCGIAAPPPNMGEPELSPALTLNAALALNAFESARKTWVGLIFGEREGRA